MQPVVYICGHFGQLNVPQKHSPCFQFRVDLHEAPFIRKYVKYLIKWGLIFILQTVYIQIIMKYDIIKEYIRLIERDLFNL